MNGGECGRGEGRRGEGRRGEWRRREGGKEMDGCPLTISMRYYSTLHVMWTYGNRRLRGLVLYRILYLCTQT
jgi:hypothetical protein